MQIIHFGHACVVLETGDTRVLLDPGMFSADAADERELDAVLITHQHPDHLEPGLLRRILDGNPAAKLFVDPGSADTVQALGVRFQVVRPGEKFEVGRSVVDVVGGNHAVMHADIPMIPNVGFVLDDGAFYHPGDSFFVPEQNVDVLGLPIEAPWLKASEVVDFHRLVKPRITVPIHEATLTHPEWQYPLLEGLAPAGSTFKALERAERTKL